MLVFGGEYSASHPKNHKISAIKDLKEKFILLSFVNLSTTVCPRFSEERDFQF